LVVYDITGRVRQTLVDRRQGRGEFVAPLRADNLAAGVYVAKLWLTTGDETEVVTRKVLVAR
jgi:hypothetical protein